MNVGLSGNLTEKKKQIRTIKKLLPEPKFEVNGDVAVQVEIEDQLKRTLAIIAPLLLVVLAGLSTLIQGTVGGGLRALGASMLAAGAGTGVAGLLFVASFMYPTTVPTNLGIETYALVGGFILITGFVLAIRLVRRNANYCPTDKSQIPSFNRLNIIGFSCAFAFAIPGMFIVDELLIALGLAILVDLFFTRMVLTVAVENILGEKAWAHPVKHQNFFCPQQNSVKIFPKGEPSVKKPTRSDQTNITSMHHQLAEPSPSAPKLRRRATQVNLQNSTHTPNSKTYLPTELNNASPKINQYLEGDITPDTNSVFPRIKRGKTPINEPHSNRAASPAPWRKTKG